MISIIVPTKDRPDMLRNALTSILKQTYTDFEVIVVNDGGQSIDGLVQDKRIKYILHDVSQGAAAARNTGLTHTEGKYIAYLDDDDIYLKPHLNTLVTAIEKENVDMVYSKCMQAIKDKDGKTLEIKHGFIQPYNPQLLLVTNLMPTLTVLHKKECIDNIGLFDTDLSTHEDWDMWIRMSLRYKIKYIPIFTCMYSRQSGSSLTYTKRQDFDKTRKMLYNRYSKYTTEDIRNLQQNILENYNKGS